MTLQKPPKCERCHKYPMKVFCVWCNESVLDVCGRCLQQIAQDKKKARRRDLPGQTQFTFMDEMK